MVMEDHASVERSLVPSECHQWKMEARRSFEVLPWSLEELLLRHELHRQHRPSLSSNQTLNLEEGFWHNSIEDVGGR